MEVLNLESTRPHPKNARAHPKNIRPHLENINPHPKKENTERIKIRIKIEIFYK